MFICFRYSEINLAGRGTREKANSPVEQAGEATSTGAGGASIATWAGNEGRGEKFLFFGRNPLKSPDSQK
jgi:hypothetical protein